MPTVRIDPIGAVLPHEHNTSAANIVGAAPQWSDSSDATYGDVEDGAAGRAALYAWLPATAVTGTITRHEVFVRAVELAPLGAFDFVESSLFIPSLDYEMGRARVDAPAASTAWISSSVDTDPDVVEVARAALADGLVRVVLTGFGSTLSVRVFEVYVVLTTTITGTYPAPPLRQYPRSDGRGLSSARRVYPPSRSVQDSNRQGPGAYL